VLISLIALSLIGFFSIQEAKGVDTKLTLQAAKDASEEYLSLLKNGEYEKAYDFVYASDQSKEIRDLNLLAMELFYEEYGKIVKYSFNKSEKLDSSSMVLYYNVQYETMPMGKRITLTSEYGDIKIIKANDDMKDPAALRKMVHLMKRVAEETRGRQES
jgi:hypothetical protein